MITVRLYGLLRLDSGVKERVLEAGTVQEVLDALSHGGIDRRSLERCVILVNGAAAKKRTKLNNGDVVQLLPPVAGG